MDPIVFLPGAGGRASFWKPVADQLSGLGPVHLLSWPGFGDLPDDPSIDSLDGLYRWFLDRVPTGRIHLVAQSMGGVLAARMAIDQPQRIATLTLCATSGGVNVMALGGEDWRPAYRAELPSVPDWFIVDRTDLTARLSAIVSPMLILLGEVDPVCPRAVGELLVQHIPHAHFEMIPSGGHDLGNALFEMVAPMIRRHVLLG
jgi:pimeloyl-ACP methyl ester carboxylesterase